MIPRVDEHFATASFDGPISRGLGAVIFALLLADPAHDQDKGYHPERLVREPTRLDWEFASSSPARLPASYDSRRQRYQLFVPPKYSATQAWPLVLFLSPGDAPLGWRAWQEPCAEEGWLFASPFGLGPATPATQQIRAVLDVLDDVRRHYRIDPERTYLAGLGAGADMAGRLAGALPELFGGVICIGGDLPFPRLAHLRHRFQDRLSIALVCSRSSHALVIHQRKLEPMLGELGIRRRLWLIDDAPPGMPSSEIIIQIQRWLEEDLPRRRAETGAIGLALEDTPTRRALAQRSLARATPGLRNPDTAYRSATLLEWIVTRCGIVEDATNASTLLRQVREDATLGPILLREQEAESRKWLTARARGLEQVGELKEAHRTWDAVARLAEGADRARARKEMTRLAGLLKGRPYLGLTFAGTTTVIKEVAPQSPAKKAGLQPGDTVLRVGKMRVTTLTQLREQVSSLRHGDEVQFQIRRDGTTIDVQVIVGSFPQSGS